MRSLPRPRLILVAGVALAALATVLVLTLPGGAGPRPAATARPALIGGVPLQRARCAQWRTGAPAQRLAVVRTLAQTVGGPSGTARGTTLGDDEALALFARACVSPLARHFLLYELYIRAAGFRSLRAAGE